MDKIINSQIVAMKLHSSKNAGGNLIFVAGPQEEKVDKILTLKLKKGGQIDNSQAHISYCMMYWAFLCITHQMVISTFWCFLMRSGLL